MEIEESFRDDKSSRYGWALEQSMTRKINRLRVLLMLTAFASFIALLVGAAAEERGLQRHFQANTTRTRRVLSIITLGRRCLERDTPHIFRALVDGLSALRALEAV